MIVAKFGGTSLADARGFHDRVELVRERADAGCLVVASAMGGVSRALLQLAWTAQSEGVEATEELRAALVARHRAVVLDARLEGEDREVCLAAIDEQDRTLEELLVQDHGGARIPLSTRDRMLAVGELLSSRLLAAILRRAGLLAAWIDPRDLVVSDETFGKARYDGPATRERVRRHLLPHLRPGQVVVTGGFIARSPGGATTTLGWGASDTSATLLGAAIGADRVEIWTDVDGIATTDPRLVPDARPIRRLSFDEACDLTYFGAQVLHYSSLAPVRAAGIPLQVRNSFRPDLPGTVITAGPAGPAGIRGISVAGPMTAAEIEAMRGCGVDNTTGEPPWALAKNRTFPGDPVATDHSLSVLALVGEGLADSAAVARAEEILSAAEAQVLPADCRTHRAWRIDAARGADLLQRLHSELVGGP